MHWFSDAGGPLELGDIEVSTSPCSGPATDTLCLLPQDSHGRLCVVCPWHKHSITLDTGESLYTSINPSNPKERKYNCSKGVKQVSVTLNTVCNVHIVPIEFLSISDIQRVHHVLVEGDSVYVKLSDLSKEIESDRYFSEQYKKFIEGVLEQPIMRRPPLRYPIHSSGKDLRK